MSGEERKQNPEPREPNVSEPTELERRLAERAAQQPEVFEDDEDTEETGGAGSDAQEPEAGGEDEVSAFEAAVAALSAERDELRDQFMRARAEFENYRKRTARDMERVRKTAAEDLIRELLPALDNLERALEHVENHEDPFVKGVEMVAKQFAGALAARGLSPIAAHGEPFDPNVHDALTQQPSEEHPEGTVMQEYERGYRLGDFVLRPAKVVVSSGPVVPAAETTDSDSEEQAGNG